MKRCGTLISMTSIPSKYGIGTCGKEAYKIVDFIKAAGMSIMQILPINPTGAANSGYQSFSTFAGNPYLIDFDMLKDEGLLEDEDLKLDFGEDPRKVDYGAMFNTKLKVLERAFDRFNPKSDEYVRFCRDNEYWLDDYALFMALKVNDKWCSWQDWETKVKQRDKETLKVKKHRLAKEIRFFKFVQFEFFKQWFKFKEYANSKGIKIVGDIPIYVAEDSADIWSHPQYFQLTQDLKLKNVAGCPPDAFSKTGQKWGNPLYDWDRLEKDDYSWWIERIRFASKYYDVVRIDHFIGFDHFYAIPANDENALNGKMVNGPGKKIFEAINRKLGKVEFIAEDLGAVTNSVKELMRSVGFPGMRVIQFGLDSQDENNIHMPKTYSNNLVAYPGSHDNNTLVGFLKAVWQECNNTGNWNKLHFIERHYNKPYNDEHFDWLVYAIIEELYRSNADLVVIPVQDILCLDEQARMNIPGTANGNWEFRLLENELTDEYAVRLHEMASKTGRLN